MAKRSIITIAGNLGSGKSSTANEVAHRLGFARFSSGDFMRTVAQNRDVSLEELSRIAETDPSIDHEIDEEVRKAGEKENIVIDSRLAFHWIPESFKVFLTLSPDVAVERIWKDMQENEKRNVEEAKSKEEILGNITKRLESEHTRYRDLYGIDHTDPSNFDLVIDTSTIPLEEVVDKVIAEYKNWLAE